MSSLLKTEADAPQSLPGDLARLLQRTQAVAQDTFYSKQIEAENTALLDGAIKVAADNAPLYFRFIIPSWPPHLLLRKILRRILLPFWKGQVDFNEATRDSLRGLSRRTQRQATQTIEQQKQIDELSREVAELRALVRQLSEQSHGLRGAQDNAEAAHERRKYEASWDDAAGCVAQMLADLSDVHEAQTISPLYFDGLDEEATEPNAAQKTPLAMIAPFPPARTGVADYSVEILKPLARYYDLHLYTETGYTPRLPAPFAAASLATWEKSAPIQRRGYRSLIYQLGNSGHFHEESYNLLRRYAGITVLHDYVLAHLMIQLCRDAKQLPYRMEDELAYELGQKEAAPILHDLKSGKMSDSDLVASGIPMNRRVFARSLGVILHNEWSYKQAQKERTGDNELITLIPPVIPPVKLGQTRDEIRALRQKWGVPLDAFVIAPCGIVTETKRPFAILDAFKKLLTERPDAFLLFVGSVSLPSGKNLDEDIAKRGLDGRVKVTGYVDVPTFNEYLLLSDVCVTLRFPSQGETSGALLRMLVHGKPSIVTAIGSFDDFPDDTVHKLPTPDKMRDEVGEILEAFRLMASNAAYREKVAATGLAYVLREHSPERCARLYADFVDAVMTHPETRKKLIADWAGRDIARRAEAREQTTKLLLSTLEKSLFAASPTLSALAPV